MREIRWMLLGVLLAMILALAMPVTAEDGTFGSYWPPNPIQPNSNTTVEGEDVEPPLHCVVNNDPVYYQIDVPAGEYDVTVHYLAASNEEKNNGPMRIEFNCEFVSDWMACHAPTNKVKVDVLQHKTFMHKATVEGEQGLRIGFDYRLEHAATVSAIEVVGSAATVRINCGAMQDYTDNAGRVWKADRQLPFPDVKIQLDGDLPTNQWVNIAEEILLKMHRAGVNPVVKWGGKFTGEMNGVFYDRSGRTYVNFSGIGLWVYEGPGKTLYRADGGIFTSVAKGWSRNPYGPGFVLICSHGFNDKSAYQALAWDGKTIQTWPSDGDVGVVDWQAEGEVKPIFWKPRHNTILTVTFNADKDRQQIYKGKDIETLGALGQGVWVFTTGGRHDKPEFGIFRSDDMGKTWEQVLEGVNTWGSNCSHILSYQERAYLHTQSGLYKSEDRGKTWRLIPNSPAFTYTLQPGKDDSHMMGLAKDGVYETKDQGETWEKVIPAVPEIPTPERGTNRRYIQSHGYFDFTWDFVNDVVYASAPNQTWRYDRD